MTALAPTTSCILTLFCKQRRSVHAEVKQAVYAHSLAKATGNFADPGEHLTVAALVHGAIALQAVCP